MTVMAFYPTRAAARMLLAVTLALAPGSGVLAAEAALVLSRLGAAGQSFELSIEDLAALPQVEVATATEFTDGIVTYRGPLMRDVLARFGLDDADTLRFVAANDYYVDIPASDFREFDVILAMQADGKALSRRDKGPLWLMYPISDYPELSDPLYLRRLIWQVIRIETL